MWTSSYTEDNDKFPEAAAVARFFDKNPVKALQFVINVVKVIMVRYGTNVESIDVKDLAEICSEHNIIIAGNGTDSSIVAIPDHEETALVMYKNNLQKGNSVPHDATKELLKHLIAEKEKRLNEGY
jgi:hypothetical protein